MSSVHLHPPFRAEHVGSLLRPKPLYEKRQALEAKECSPSDLKPVEDEAIKHVLKLQQDIGIKTITDGELRRFVGKKCRSLSASVHTTKTLREYFFDGVFDKLEGMVYIPNRAFLFRLLASCLSWMIKVPLPLLK